MPLVALPLIPLIAAVVAALLPTEARNRAAGLAGVAALVGLVDVLVRFAGVRDGGVVVERVSWITPLGFDLVLRLDGLTWLFCVLVLGIGVLVTLYARYYLSSADPVPRFFAYLLGFMSAMLGVVLSGNVLQIAFFWELTSLLSFLLIGYWNQRADAQRGARMALVVNAAGGACLLVGLLVLGRIAGSWELDAILASPRRITDDALYPVALCLILLGTFTKSAQVPFHFWLPNAMAAPTPVSAYLHSATMVKLGVFVLVRVWPVLSGTDLWFWLVGSAGLATLLLGAWAALFQHDLKRLLAYSTISHLGLIVLLLGLNSALAAVAAVFHVMNHAAFKASLFMAVGIIDHETGTRDMRRLSGLFRLMPITGTLALVATAAMAGVPLLNGFLSKEMFFSETVFVDAIPAVQWGLPIVATLAGMGSVGYSLRLAAVFFGAPGNTPRPAEEPPAWMRVPVEVLVLVCVIVGVAPALSVGPVLDAASRQVIGGPLPAFSLAVWHGFTPALLMSVLAMAGGIVLYLVVRRLGFDRGGRRRTVTGLDGGAVYASILAALTRASRWTQRRLLRAGLQRQLLAVVVVTMLAAGTTLWGGVGEGDRPRVPLSPVFLGLWMVGGTAAVAAAAMAKFHRLAALMLAGTAGAVTCITFIWFSAPDLALTQLTVEVMTTMLLLLGLRWLPRREPERGIYTPETWRRAMRRRSRDFTVAVAAGSGMAGLAYAVMTRELPERTSFFLEHALSDGGGRNVVNVMLVDFRGYDTFGEGVVLVVAALTTYALLRRFRPASHLLDLPPQQRIAETLGKTDLVTSAEATATGAGYLVVPRVLVSLMLPVCGVVAAFFFLRGHDAPGGGFVAGLVMTIGFLLQYVVWGTEWVESRLRLAPPVLMGVGLLLMLGTAVGAPLAGHPLLTSYMGHVHLPLVGEVHLGTPLLFDAGVFSLVFGATLLILVALAHQSIRARRRTRGE
jgi:multicomponent K+:H+ antiporter subunit A